MFITSTAFLLMVTTLALVTFVYTVVVFAIDKRAALRSNRAPVRKNTYFNDVVLPQVSRTP